MHSPISFTIKVPSPGRGKETILYLTSTLSTSTPSIEPEVVHSIHKFYHLVVSSSSDPGTTSASEQWSGLDGFKSTHFLCEDKTNSVIKELKRQ